MLRFSSIRGVSSGCALIRKASHTAAPSTPTIFTPSVTGSSAISNLSLNLYNFRAASHHNLSRQITLNNRPTTNGRFLSSNASSDKKSGGAEGEDEGKELVLTPGQKVVVASKLTMWAGVAVFASFCAYYIIKELLPSKMSPNSVFDASYAIIKDNSEVNRRFGGPLKAYGKDWGGHREGRRNFVEHTEHTDEEDGSKRTRVRYNLEGKHGVAFVYAEVSKNMPSGEFVYILVQDKSNGRVITVVDNRSKLAAERMMGGNKEGMNAFANLMGGAKSDRN